eukprot:scaffold179536_cov18-Prasinocladus_malaysianus.AAC.1
MSRSGHVATMPRGQALCFNSSWVLDNRGKRWSATLCQAFVKESIHMGRKRRLNLKIAKAVMKLNPKLAQ